MTTTIPLQEKNLNTMIDTNNQMNTSKKITKNPSTSLITLNEKENEINLQHDLQPSLGKISISETKTPNLCEQIPTVPSKKSDLLVEMVPSESSIFSGKLEVVPHLEEESIIVDSKEQPYLDDKVVGKFMNDYQYTDFGVYDQGDDQNDVLFEITNDIIDEFDVVDVDDNMCLFSDEDFEYELSEEDEAFEYANFLNLRSTEHAIVKVGTNEMLLSWIEKEVSLMDNQSISNYERITLEIEKVQRKLKSGIEIFFSNYLQTNVPINVSDNTIEFCRRLFSQYVEIVLDTSLMISHIRDQGFLEIEDFVTALKHLGRRVYFEPYEILDEENDPMIFDNEVMKILINIVLEDIIIEGEEIYDLLQRSFEDFFGVIVENACKLQKEYKGTEPITTEDLKMVISLWKGSPYEQSTSLINKLN